MSIFGRFDGPYVISNSVSSPKLAYASCVSGMLSRLHCTANVFLIGLFSMKRKGLVLTLIKTCDSHEVLFYAQC